MCVAPGPRQVHQGRGSARSGSSRLAQTDRHNTSPAGARCHGQAPSDRSSCWGRRRRLRSGSATATATFHSVALDRARASSCLPYLLVQATRMVDGPARRRGTVVVSWRGARPRSRCVSCAGASNHATRSRSHLLAPPAGDYAAGGAGCGCGRLALPEGKGLARCVRVWLWHGPEHAGIYGHRLRRLWLFGPRTAGIF